MKIRKFCILPPDPTTNSETYNPKFQWYFDPLDQVLQVRVVFCQKSWNSIICTCGICCCMWWASYRSEKWWNPIMNYLVNLLKFSWTKSRGQLDCTLTIKLIIATWCIKNCLFNAVRSWIIEKKNYNLYMYNVNSRFWIILEVLELFLGKSYTIKGGLISKSCFSLRPHPAKN